MSAPTGGSTATVTVAPVAGSRSLRIRPNRGTSDAPATLALGSTLVPVVGQQVLVDVVGRRLVVRGGA